MKRTIWFTGDTHFCHANVIKYCNRPFGSVEDMDYTLIRNWNSVVQPLDTVYHVGDVVFNKNSTKVIEILSQLNGEIHLIKGNHDNYLKEETLRYFASVEKSGLKEIKIQDSDAKGDVQRITLCHYAMKVWNLSHYGSWHLYGHSHGTMADNPNSLSLDVGVDCWNYHPVSYQQIKERMKLKTFVPIDQHREKKHE